MIIDELFANTTSGTTKQFFSESKHRKLIREDSTYRKFHNLSRLLAERKMSEKEILDLFAAVEQGANATGQNRTALGRGKDAVAGAYTSAKDAISGVLNSIQKSTPVAGVDAAYNDATGALRDALGGNSRIMDAVKKYRLLAKEYPKTQLFVKTALIALAGLATGGAGLPAIAGLTAAVDSAIKGEKLSSIIGKGAGAAIMGLGAQKVNAMLAADQGLAPHPSAASDFGAGTYDGGVSSAAAGAPVADFGTYTVMKGDQLGYIAQANGVSVEELRGLNPQIDFAKPLQPGMELVLPPGGNNAGSVWQGYQGGMYGDKVPGPEQLGGVNPSSAADAAATTPSAAPIDYSKAGPISTDSLGQKLEYGIPVNDKGSFIPPNPNLPADELAKQTAAYDTWKANFMERYPNATQAADGSMQGQIGGTGLAPMYPSNPLTGSDIGAIRPKGVIESVKLIKLPAEQLIDQKLTVMAWALNESVGKPPARNIHLTRRGVLTVIENVDRHRRALLKELAADGPDRTNIPAVRRADMPLAPQDGVVKPGMVGRGLNWLDKATSKVGGYLSKQAQNFTRKVTAAKLKTEWEQEGHQTDSDYIAAFLAKQGVPQEVVNDVYSSMGIPLADPSVTQPKQSTSPDLELLKKATLSLQGGPELSPEELKQVNDYRISKGADPIPTPVQQTSQTKNATTQDPSSVEIPIASGVVNPATGKVWLPSELRAAQEKRAAQTQQSTTQAQTEPTTTTTPTRTGGKVKGQVSMTPDAIRKRKARAKATAANTAGAAAFGQMSNNLTKATAPVTKPSTVAPTAAVKPGTPASTALPIATSATAPAPSSVTYKGFAAPKPAPATTNFAKTGFTGYKLPGTTTTPTVPNLTQSPAKVKPLAKQEPITIGGQKIKPTDPAYAKIMKNAPAVAESATRAYEKIAVADIVKQVIHQIKLAETKDDLKKIKQSIDRQFSKHGLVSESAFVKRDILVKRANAKLARILK